MRLTHYRSPYPPASNHRSTKHRGRIRTRPASSTTVRSPAPQHRISELQYGSYERSQTLTLIDDPRFKVPLYTIGQAARIVDVPNSTFATWAKGYLRRPPDRPDVTGQPVLTCLTPVTRTSPSIPFVGLAEGLVLAAIRRSGVPMQRIRPALDELQRQIGIDHALASQHLFTDGAELLYDYAEQNQAGAEGIDTRTLIVIRNGQRVFSEVVEQYLQLIRYGSDGYASVIKVPAYRDAEVVADPGRSFGSPVFERGGARVSDVLERFWAGEPLSELSGEFGVPPQQLEDVVRATSRRAA